MRMTLEIHRFILSNAWAINYYLLRVSFDMERKGHGCVTYITVPGKTSLHPDVGKASALESSECLKCDNSSSAQFDIFITLGLDKFY